MSKKLKSNLESLLERSLVAEVFIYNQFNCYNEVVCCAIFPIKSVDATLTTTTQLLLRATITINQRTSFNSVKIHFLFSIEKKYFISFFAKFELVKYFIQRVLSNAKHTLLFLFFLTKTHLTFLF